MLRVYVGLGLLLFALVSELIRVRGRGFWVERGSSSTGFRVQGLGIGG